MNFKLRILFSMVITVIVTNILIVTLLDNMSINELGSTIRKKSERDLLAKRESMTAKTEAYFTRIEKQIITMSANSQTEQAALEFISAFDSYASERGKLSQTNIENSLNRYYYDGFGKKFQLLNDKSVDVKPLYRQLSHTTQLLQYDFISNNPSALGEKDQLVAAKEATSYKDVHIKHHEDFQLFLQEFGYYDIFIVDAKTGNIVYSVFKELDYATNLNTGPYAKTGIAEAFKKAKGLPANATYITDFQAYLPSYNGAASFIASPIVVQGTTEAVLIFQMPLAEINKIMTHDNEWMDKGFGETGETYLVGTDRTLRNESRFFIEDKVSYLDVMADKYPTKTHLIETQGTSIGIQPVQGFALEEALQGNKGFTVVNDYRGEPVLSAYGPIHYGSHTWAILSEIDEEEAYRAIDVLSERIMTWSITAIIVLSVITFILAYWLAYVLARPILNLGQEVNNLNSGDANLSIVLKKSGIKEIDHVTQEFNKFIAMLKGIIDSIKVSTDNIAASSTQLSSNTEQTTQSAHEQKQLSHDMSDALQQFYQAIEEVAENSVNASIQTTKAKGITEENAERSQLAREKINQLVSEVTHSSETLNQLQNQVNSINDVLNVITSIAEQTNLLALNAAIEAARAGEQGRGFAVVADEVRQLATRTQQSTVEIQQNIGSLTTVAEKAVESMERASLSADDGIQLVDLVSTSLEDLLNNIRDLDNINQTVASASEEQKYTCDEIMKNMGDVEKSASDVLSASTDVANASTMLSGIASDLQGQTKRFK